MKIKPETMQRLRLSLAKAHNVPPETISDSDIELVVAYYEKLLKADFEDNKINNQTING